MGSIIISISVTVCLGHVPIIDYNIYQADRGRSSWWNSPSINNKTDTSTTPQTNKAFGEKTGSFNRWNARIYVSQKNPFLGSVSLCCPRCVLLFCFTRKLQTLITTQADCTSGTFLLKSLQVSGVRNEDYKWVWSQVIMQKQTSLLSDEMFSCLSTRLIKELFCTN